MKKIICLPLVAIIVLSGCKGNSFLMQRYTNYGQASHKTCSKEIALAKKQVLATTESKKETERVISAKEEPILASSNSSIKENILARIPVQIYTTDLKVTKPEQLDTKDLKQVSKSQKTSQKKQAAKK
ncbi:MAG: hypothetical protein JNJ41_01020 [Bacteroidia bacterium]|nr:hypothetical protein [Bacteroidia bacterium]